MPTKEISAQIERYLSAHRAEIVENFRRIVAVESVSDASAPVAPYGAGCRAALELGLSMAREKGLAVENCDFYYGLARLPRGARTLGIFSHLDVVPAGAGWIYSPYQPVVKDGFLIGRGSADNKNAFIIGLYVLSCIRELALPCRSSLLLYLGCAEETGMSDVRRFAQEQRMPDFSIVPDTSFPVSNGEKGLLEISAVAPEPFAEIRSLSGGCVANMVADRATAVLPRRDLLAQELAVLTAQSDRLTLADDGEALTVTARGISAHASLPEGSLNAIGLLCDLLAHCRTLSPLDAALCARVAHSLSDNYGEHLGIAFADAPSGRLTCIGGVAETVDGRLSVRYDMRYPVTDRGDRVIAGFTAYFARYGWSAQDVDDSAPYHIPADDPKVQTIARLYTALTGRDGTPYTMGGGTYARYLRHAVSFGPNENEQHPDLPASLGLPAGHGSIHQPDEAFSIDKLLEAIRLYTLCLLEIDAQLQD